MKKVEKQEIQKHGKSLKIHKSERGWAITVMPDTIRADNYYKPPHIHVKNKGIHLPLKYTDFDSTGLIIERHIDKNNGINLEKLLEELI